MRSRLFILLSCLSFLTSGCYMSEDCKEKTCWNASITPTSCGVKIVNHCQVACDACDFNEQPCKICMDCMSSEGGWPPDAYSAPQYCSMSSCRHSSLFGV